MEEMYNMKHDQEGTEVPQQEAKRPLLVEQLVNGTQPADKGGLKPTLIYVLSQQQLQYFEVNPEIYIDL